MKLVTFTEAVQCTFSKSAGHRGVIFAPGISYVVSDRQFHDLTSQHNFLARQSDLGSRVPNFRAGVSKGRVLFYSGAGGYGDQILAWPVVKLLAEMGYEMHVLVDPGNESCWYMQPWVKQIVSLPVAQAYWDTAFDHYAIFESTTNLDEHPDQAHPVDALLYKIGIENIPPHLKVLAPRFTQGEMQLALRATTDRQVGLFQLCASQKSRSLPPEQAAFVMQHLAKAFPDVHWMGVHDSFADAAYPDAVKKLGLNTCTMPRLRDLFALVSFSKIVVAPDSLLVHLAGAHGIPCVGLWGMIDPAKRVAYYKNHMAVYMKSACANSPCFYAGGSVPPYCPPAVGTRSHCECLLQVEPRHVVEAVRSFGDFTAPDRALPTG